MRVFPLALILVVPGGLAHGQSEPSSPSQATGASAAVAESAASGEVVDQLVKELSITPAQASGAAGTLFGLAKTKLSADEFAKVAGTVPNMDELLKTAPAADAKASALQVMAGSAASAGGLGGVASVAGSLTKLGLKPETIAKLAPTLVKAVQSKGGAEVASLLAGAFK